MKSLLLATATLATALPQLSLRADTLPVTDAASFVSALNDAFNNPTRSDVVSFGTSATIDLSVLAQRQVLPLYKIGGATIVINGGNATLDCGNALRPFFILAGTVSINNLTIINARARGGDGGSASGNAGGGGGGGLGAGGAIFVNNLATVALQDVQFSNCQAVGGNGTTLDASNPGGSGGGGLGGNGGNRLRAGGGGLFGNGGEGSNSAGGGGGLAGNGGNGGSSGPSGAGGGGGITGNGGNGGSNGQAGGNGSSLLGGGGGGGNNGAGGTGSGSAGSGAAGGSVGAGGGGGGGGVNGGSAIGNTGGAGGFGGGGGGSALADGYSGGAGGLGGGGGGGHNGNGGVGGDFGGGGGAYFGGVGGVGGFGGGGGGAADIGGAGGFGGGGGGAFSGAGGTGGTFGGNGSVGSGNNGSGGGGAALGGAIFVRQGGSLALSGPLGLSGGSVTAGTAGSVTAGAGSAFGTGIFLQGNGTTLTFSVPTGIGQTITDVIADQTGSGGAAGNSGSILKVGAGILTLSGENTYTGTTTVNAGTLNLNNLSGSATGTSSVIIASGATLGGVGIATGPVAMRDGGSITPAQGSRLALGSLTWDGGGTVSVAIGNASLPPVQITGALQKGAAGVYTIGLTDDGVTAGATYTLMTFGSQTGFTASDFTVTGVAGTLSLTGTELRFTTAALPPVYGVALDATKGNERATFTLTNTGDTTTSFRLARLSRITGGGHHHGPKPPKPRIELVYLLNGANITSALEKGRATATLAPGATAQVVVKVKTHGAHRQRTIRVSLSATSVADPSVSATAKVSFVLKANR